jgi:hypothetical protein
MDDDFSGSLDSTNWSLDIELGGFGYVPLRYETYSPCLTICVSNGEFEMTTDSPSNVYISNGQLYIMPTLTSDTIDGGYGAVMNNGSYQLPDCTTRGGGKFFSW